jgi:hypothetical protein
MNIDQFRDITSKAGGLIILLPRNLSMSNEDKEVSAESAARVGHMSHWFLIFSEPIYVGASHAG